MAFTDDGTLAAVVTYAGVHLFPRAKGETWEQALGRPATQVLRHSMMQAESVAFSPDGKTLRIVSEGVHSPILTWKRD